MIELRNVSKAYRTKTGWHQVLDNISVTFPKGHGIGILGLNGAGKSTLLRLIGGVEDPDEGEIYKELRTSWPIGFSGGMHAMLTGRENARFIGRIYQVDLPEIEAFVEEMSELGSYFDMPVRTYSSGMRARLAFSASMALKFECYLVDEVTAAGDRRFKHRYMNAFKERHSDATLIMVSHQSRTIEQFCDMAAVLKDGKLTLYDTVAEGMAAYEKD